VFHCRYASTVQNAVAHLLAVVCRVPEIRNEPVWVGNTLDVARTVIVLYNAQNDVAAVSIAERTVRFPEIIGQRIPGAFEFNALRLPLHKKRGNAFRGKSIHLYAHSPGSLTSMMLQFAV
jgi:hypothetical protein